jgi:hypothetical protein
VRLDRVSRDARGFWQFLSGGDLRGGLLAQRRALAQELVELSRSVPEDVTRSGHEN